MIERFVRGAIVHGYSSHQFYKTSASSLRKITCVNFCIDWLVQASSLLNIMSGALPTSSETVPSDPGVGIQNPSNKFELIASPKANDEVDPRDLRTAPASAKKAFFPATLFVYPPIKDRSYHR